MLKIAFIIYRQWGYDIFQKIKEYQKIRQDFSIPLLIVNNEHEFVISTEDRKQSFFAIVKGNDNRTIYNLLKKHKIDIACFFSWSWILDSKLVNQFICLCLHPSLLPRYRGGSPIQHQIIKNEKKTGITIFRMTDVIDGGPVYLQKPLSLAGDIQDILERMTEVGTIMTKRLISDAVNNKLIFKPQKNLKQYPPNKRRTPEQSEIKFSELKKIKFSELKNLIRGLLAPYPNVYLKMYNGTKIKLQKVEYYKNIPKTAIILNDVITELNKDRLFLKLTDGFAKIVKFELDA